MGEVLDIVCALAGSRTVGAFIDQAMEELASAVAGTLVSFNRMDLDSRTASVAMRPYRAEHETAIHGVARLLEEHPFYRWYRTQPDWSPVRISDVVPWREFRNSRLLVEVLRPAGACHSILVMLAPLVAGEWAYFMVNRADPDFTDDELRLCVRLQPALVALYVRLAIEGEPPGSGLVALTRRADRAGVPGRRAYSRGHRAPAAGESGHGPQAPAEPLRQAGHLRSPRGGTPGA